MYTIKKTDSSTMSFFSESDEVDETCENDFDKENNLSSLSQCFPRKTGTIDCDPFDESLDKEMDDLNKLTQHANKKVLYTQNIANKLNLYGSQSNESLKTVTLPVELESFFKNIGVEVIETEEYSTCINVIDASVEYKGFVNRLKDCLQSPIDENLMPAFLSIITLKDKLQSFKILEVLSRPVKIGGNFSNSFLQILVSIKELQTEILREIFKYFERSTSEDMTVKLACDIYLDLLKDTDEIYEQEKIYLIISSLKYDMFDTTYRNELAGILYKFIQNFKLENELYRGLMKWMKRNDLDDCENFRLALLESIKNVAADPANIKLECFGLIKNINMFECNTTLEIINYTSMALTSDNRNQIVLFLSALRQNLRFGRFEELVDFDKIICNMFYKIMMLITNYGVNGINIVLSVLNASNNNKITYTDFGVTTDVMEEELVDINGEDEGDIEDDGGRKETILKRRFSEFDYILSITTISEYINPPISKIKDIAKLMAANIEHHSESFEEDCKFISKLFKCEDFSLKFLESLMYIGEYFLKDNVQVVNEMGKYIFLEMFSNLCYDREKIISLLIDNILSKDDVSCNALQTINSIVRKCSYEFADYIDYFLERTSSQCVNFKPKMLRTFFKILSSLSILCNGKEVESKISSMYDRFDQFLKSTDENSFRVALSANIVRICELIRKDPEKYSSEISSLLEKLDCCSNYMPQFRAYYFSEFSVNLRSGYAKFLKQSNELIEYMNKNVLHYVKDTYFMYLEKPLDYTSSEDDDFCSLFEGYNNLDAQYLVKHTTFLKRNLKNPGIWNVEMLNPLIPMIQFIYQVLRLVNKWKQQDDKASLENLYFIFEANIDLRGIESMIKKEKLNDRELSDLRISIIFLLDYISNLLNTFAECRSSPKHNEILQKKYKLYVKLEDLLFNHINSKYKKCFMLPHLLSNGYSISKNSVVLFGLKKSNIPTKKKVIKSEVDCDKSIIDDENNAENGNIETVQDFENTQAPANKKISKKLYYKILPFSKISEHITPFSINVLVKCIDAFLESPHLLSTVLNGINVAVGRIEDSFSTKRITNFGFSKGTEVFFPYVDKQSKKDLKELLSNCVTPMMTVFDYCKNNLTNESEDILYQNFADHSLKIILRSIKFSTTNDDYSSKIEIENKIFQFISTKSLNYVPDNNAELGIFNYFLESESCLVASSTMAVSIVEMLLDFTKENELLRLKLAKKCLDLLDYPWPVNSSINCSTVSYCKDITKILEIYFNLISPKYQIFAVTYVVTKKLVFLAPTKDQKELMEIGFTYNLNFGKLAISNPEELCIFKATTPKTFCYLYNICFVALNTATQRILAKNETGSTQSIEKNLNLWYFSATCFSKLTDFINIQKFRTKFILSTVIKEGKKFVDFINSNKSTFMMNVVDEKKFNQHKERFEQIFDIMEKSYSNISSYNNEFRKKLTGTTLKLFPQFICGFESFHRFFLNISKISAASASLNEKLRKRSSNTKEVVKPKKKKKSGGKGTSTECIENMEI